MPRYWIRSLAVKSKQTEQTVPRWSMAVRCIGEGMSPVCIEHIQYRTLLIGRQQSSADLRILAAPLRQQLIVVLEDAALYCVLYLSG